VFPRRAHIRNTLGIDRIRSGNEFTSVTHGLALRAMKKLRQAQ
jgi:hypothetical protein